MFREKNLHLLDKVHYHYSSFAESGDSCFSGWSASIDRTVYFGNHVNGMECSGAIGSFDRTAIEKTFGMPFDDGNRVTLLWKGRDTFQKIFDAVNAARRIICLEFYIFRNDETGTELASLVKKKAERGVEVYIIYDHFGSFGTPRKFWNDLKEAGVAVCSSRPFKWTDPFHYVHRDHKKLIIVDGEVAFTGGLNIANEYRGHHRLRYGRGWRDTGILLEGPIVRTLLEIFKKSWRVWGGAEIAFDRAPKADEEGVPALPIFVNSARQRRRMRRLLYYSIERSERCIYLTTAYFAPSRRMLRVLEDAESRGVDVKLLLPGASDIIAVHYAARAFFTRLLKAGVEIYTYQGEILHAKTAVFDGIWSIVGSANLDFQSLRRNDEGNVGILDRHFGEQMIEMFREDLAHSERVTLDAWERRPLLERFVEWFFALFRRRL